MLQKEPFPIPPHAKLPSDCDFSALVPTPPTSTSPQLVLPAGLHGPNQTIFGGTYVGGGDLVIDKPILLRESLVIVVWGDLIIDAVVSLDTGPTSGNSFGSITLVSIQGDIFTRGDLGWRYVTVGPPTPQQVKGNPAAGVPGENGGHIRLIAPAGMIIVGNPIWGLGGSRGADAIGVANGGECKAAGGPGGYGGDVVLCAGEGIVIAAPVWGGPGGDGGAASIDWGKTPANGAVGWALGGDAGDGGNVVVCATGKGVTVKVLQTGELVGGSGSPTLPPKGPRPFVAFPAYGEAGVGGNAEASGTNGAKHNTKHDGNAFAQAGRGANGGTVLFSGQLKIVQRGPIRAGDGGVGGKADANGGAGENGPHPSRGGNAEAVSGNGGDAGPLPRGPGFTGGPGTPGIAGAPPNATGGDGGTDSVTGATKKKAPDGTGVDTPGKPGTPSQ